MTLVRFEPLKEFDSFADQIQKYFSDFPGFQPNHSFSPRIDISENKNEILVEAEMPGLQKENIKLTLEDNILTIEGKKEKANLDKDDKVHRTERIFGSFKRSFTLPVDVDPEKVNAKFENGVLKITLEKIDLQKNKEKVIELK